MRKGDDIFVTFDIFEKHCLKTEILIKIKNSDDICAASSELKIKMPIKKFGKSVNS